MCLQDKKILLCLAAFTERCGKYILKQHLKLVNTYIRTVESVR